MLLSSICSIILLISSTNAFSTIYNRTPRHLSTSLQMTTSPRHIVVIGAGIQGTSVAYHLHARSESLPPNSTITLLESNEPASAASGKGGGFMARSWGSGSTVALHELAFDLYEEYCREWNVESYRKLPVLSVSPSSSSSREKKSVRERNPQLAQNGMLPDWLDGSVGRIR